MSLPPEIAAPRDGGRGSKLGDLVRRLSSDSDGEVVATVRAMNRTLKSAGTDFHGLAEHIETANGRHVPEEQLQKVWDTAFAAGVQAAENRQHGSDDFIGTDGKPTWQAVALFLQRNKHRLNPRVHEFVDKMAALIAWDEEQEPSPRQHKYMHSLFYELGGKIT
jgi:hypothetical protein